MKCGMLEGGCCSLIGIIDPRQHKHGAADLETSEDLILCSFDLFSPSAGCAAVGIKYNRKTMYLF